MFCFSEWKDQSNYCFALATDSFSIKRDFSFSHWFWMKTIVWWLIENCLFSLKKKFNQHVGQLPFEKNLLTNVKQHVCLLSNQQNNIRSATMLILLIYESIRSNHFNVKFVSKQMSLNLTCFQTNENYFNFTNKSNSIYEHQFYQINPSFLSRFALFLSNSLFSSNDFRILFQNFLLNQNKLPTKFVSSILIYSILILILFVTLSILFYIISYSNVKINRNLLKSRWKYVYLLVLMMFSFYFLIEMIFLIEDLNHLKSSLEKSFDYLKKEFNSKLFVKHLNDLFVNLQSLKNDENLFDSIEHFIKKMFVNLLNKNYSLDKLNKYLNNINEFIQNNSLNELFRFYLNLIEDISKFNSNLCFYFNENYLQFERDLSKIFSSIEKQFEILIEILNEQILTKINWKFVNDNQIYSIISLVTNLTILCLSFLTLIPIGFFIMITINYFSVRLQLK